MADEKGFYSGQMLDKGVEFIVMLGFLALLGGAFAIALSGFAGSSSDATAVAIIGNGSQGLLNMSLQLPVVGTEFRSANF